MNNYIPENLSVKKISYIYVIKMVDSPGVAPGCYIKSLQTYTSLSLIIHQCLVEHHIEVEV